MGDWVYLPDPSTGSHYYANLTTGATTWERPAEIDGGMPTGGGGGGSASSAVAVSFAVGSGSRETTRVADGRKSKPGRKSTTPAKWVEYMDETQGIPYYYNEMTGESTWVLPADDDDDDDWEEEELAPADAADEEAKRKEKAAAHRLKILEEILSTEQTYVSALHVCKKVYLDPLRMVADVPKAAIFTHDDLDAIFLNLDVITKVNDKFLEELKAEQANWPHVKYADLFRVFSKQFKGCYTRYVNNFDAAEAKLRAIRASAEKQDQEKNRYLVSTTRHPEAAGKDVTSFLIQPVQRVLRYRLLLADLLKHTPEGHPDQPAVQEAHDRICELAQSFNEDKRTTDDFAKLRDVFGKFVDSEEATLRKEFLSYERKLLKEGSLVKVRLSHRQRRTLFLFNDVLLYAAQTMKGHVLKGRIKLHDGARVESLPQTEDMPFSIAIIEKSGKGYTWLCESQQEKEEWLSAMDAAIKTDPNRSSAMSGNNMLAHIESKSLEERLEAVRSGGALTKYNKADGKSKLRWVVVRGEKICWGDTKSKDCKSEQKLGDATALLYGAKSSSFFKQKGSKSDQDWQCFSIVFKERTLDFAATSASQLLDWYLALASLVPQSTEPLLPEEELRRKMETMCAEAGPTTPGAGSARSGRVNTRGS